MELGLKLVCLGVFGLVLTGCTPPGPKPPASAANNGAGGVLNVADAAIADNDPAMALQVSQSVLANDPNNLQALYHEAAAYYAVGRCEDAVAAYRVALGINPKSSEAETGIGRCLIKRNAIEAEQAFDAAVQDDPGNAAALNDLGIARDLQGNYAGATKPYELALLINPGVTATEVNLGLSLALSGDAQDALEYLGPLATSSAATPRIREDYAAALVAAGRTNDAEQVLAIDLPPDEVNTLMADFQTAISNAQSAQAPVAAPATMAEAPTAAVATVAPVAVQALIGPTPAAPPPPAAVTPMAAPAPTGNAAAGDDILR